MLQQERSLYSRRPSWQEELRAAPAELPHKGNNTKVITLANTSSGVSVKAMMQPRKSVCDAPQAIHVRGRGAKDVKANSLPTTNPIEVSRCVCALTLSNRSANENVPLLREIARTIGTTKLCKLLKNLMLR